MESGKQRGTMLWRVLMVTGLAIGVALPAGASQHEGVVDITVTVAEAPPGGACLLVEISALDFGTVALESHASSSRIALYWIEKCAGSQDLFVQGTNASLTDGSTWDLVAQLGAAAPGVNEYFLDASSINSHVQLDPNVAKLFQANMHTGQQVWHDLVMPQAGSDGVGQVASFQVIWTAVLSG